MVCQRAYATRLSYSYQSKTQVLILNEYTRGRAMLKKLLRKSSNIVESSSENHLNLGLAYYQKGDYKRAIESLTKAIELDPHSVAAYNNRGQAYSESNHWEQATRDFTRAIELAPDLAGIYSNRGGVYRKSGNLERAIQDFDRAIELDPGFATAYYNRGLVYADSSDLQQAIRDLTKAIELAPDLAQAYNNRGIAYRRSSNLELAIQDYNRAIELAPDYAEAYSNRGFAYAGSGDLERAVRDFSKAIDLSPELALAYRHRGRAYYESGNLEQAIRDLNRAISLDRDDALAHFSRGLVYLDSDNADAAYVDFLTAARIDPDSADFTRLRLAYANSSKYDPYYVKAGIPHLLAQTGKAFTEGTYTQSTLQSIGKILSLNYMHLQTHMTAVLAYTQLGDEQRAAHHQKFVRHWAGSILNSGDGRSPDTAFIVMSLDEEFALLKVLGISPTLQHLDMQDDHVFDIFEFADPQTGQSCRIYFNIDLIVKGVREGRAEMPSKANLPK